MTCPICCLELLQSEEDDGVVEVSFLACGHGLHTSCAKSVEKQRKTCAVCCQEAATTWVKLQLLPNAGADDQEIKAKQIDQALANAEFEAEANISRRQKEQLKIGDAELEKANLIIEEKQKRWTRFSRRCEERTRELNRLKQNIAKNSTTALAQYINSLPYEGKKYESLRLEVSTGQKQILRQRMKATQDSILQWVKNLDNWKEERERKRRRKEIEAQKEKDKFRRLERGEARLNELLRQAQECGISWPPEGKKVTPKATPPRCPTSKASDFREDASFSFCEENVPIPIEEDDPFAFFGGRPSTFATDLYPTNDGWVFEEKKEERVPKRHRDALSRIFS